MKTETPATPKSPDSAAGITIDNRLHPGHHYQAAVDDIFRVALRGLPGPWDVSVYAVGRAWFRIDVVAPDGARWSTSVPVHEGPRVEDLADAVRAACVRHGRRRPASGKPANKAAASAGDRALSPKAGSQKGRVVSAAAAPKGTPK